MEKREEKRERETEGEGESWRGRGETARAVECGIAINLRAIYEHFRLVLLPFFFFCIEKFNEFLSSPLSLSLSLFFSREPVIIRSFVEVSRLSAQSVPGRLNFHETSDANLITAKLSRAQKNRSIVERLIESRNSSRVARARRTRYMRIYIRFRLETGNRPTRLKMSARSLCPPSQLPDRTNRYADPPRRIRPRYTAKQEVFPPTGNKRGKFRRI